MLSIQYSLYMSIQHNEHDVYIIYLFNCSCDISIGWCFHSRIEHLVSPVCNFWRWPRQSVLVECLIDVTATIQNVWKLSGGVFGLGRGKPRRRFCEVFPKQFLHLLIVFESRILDFLIHEYFIYLGTQLHKETYWNRSWPGSTAHEFRFASIPRWQSWGWPSRVRLTPVKLQAWPGRWGRHWYFDTF